jgi:hypothetical protein
MGMAELLRGEGYELDDEQSDLAAPTEVWINREAGLGVRLEWFRLGT